MSRRVVIVGATSRIAECCARLYAAEGASLLLAGRNASRLTALAQDLQVRAGGRLQVKCCRFDAADPDAPAALLMEALSCLGGIDLLLVAHGYLPDQAAAQSDLKLCHAVLETNGVSACLVAEAFAGHFEQRRSGCIAVIGSVAGDRGRQSNYIYGAAKGLIEIYLQGLRNRLHRAGVVVLLIKPGPTETPMTSDLGRRGTSLASPEQVARDIVRAIESRRRLLYTPAKWRLIMAVIRAIPESIFVRLRL